MYLAVPRDAPVSLVLSSTGRPVFKSTTLAQLTNTYGWARSTSPVVRSRV